MLKKTELGTNAPMVKKTDTPSSEHMEDKLIIVGIGASAGGLDACRKMLRNIDNRRACYVLCQHLSPTHESKLSEILTRDTNLKVRQIRNNDKAKQGYLFIAPPNANLELKDDHFHLSEPKKGPYPKPDVNKFFVSLAENSGNQAIAVILSGTGSDGATGVSKIRGLGGVVIAQDPNSSDYDGMPNASIATHMVDMVGSAETIGQQLTKIIGNGSLDSADLLSQEKDTYDSILRAIAEETKIDFKQYKQSTIQRRLNRRLAIKGIPSLKNYLTLLENSTEEIWSFAQDAFIVVSEFYRDVDAFAQLQIQITKRLRQLTEPVQLRIWVAGCATGDEAYTMAMLLEEIKNTESLAFEYKILATDISERAISLARKAQYTFEKLTKVPHEWIDRYFEHYGESYEVRGFIRERIVFSVHNIFSDPPFSKLDIVSCRNLLIYFDSDLQEQMTELFHYSLNDSGILFVGTSENVKKGEFFDQLHQKEQIYKKTKADGMRAIVPAVRRITTNAQLNAFSTRRESVDTEKRILKALNKCFTPSCIVIDADNRMVFSQGDYACLLAHSQGFVSNQLFDVIMPNLRADCRALVFRARQSGETCIGSKQVIQIDGESVGIYLSVSSLSDELSNWVCVSYYRARPTHEGGVPDVEAPHPAMREMEQELSATRENLQTVIEQLETANEQLQLFNEELQSSNEEYQSTNEELQTVNEELQSTNEELLTVNEEYALKTAEQSRLWSDLSNIQESIDIPFFLISTEYRIQRFTRSCAKLIDTKKIKIDDIFFALQGYSGLPDLKNVIEKVKTSLETERLDVKIDDGHYQCQVSPYFNASHDFDGYTIIFYDTTDFEQSQNDLKTEKLQAQTTLETVMEGVLRVGRDKKIEYANPAALQVLERDLDETVGRRIDKRLRFFGEHGDEFDIASAIDTCIETKECFSTGSQSLALKTQFGRDIYIELSVAPLSIEQDTISGCVVAFRDVSERQAQLSRLRWQSQHDSLTGLVNRNEMEKRIEHGIMSAKRDGAESSLLYLDLDQFKVINDTCGHLAGDRLLQQLSQLMSEMLRSRDTLARLGGDEFALMLDRCPLAESETIAEKIQKKIREYRFVWDDKVFRVGVCIGIVSINRHVNQVSEVLSDADAACYAAKESGRNAIQVHSKDNEMLEKQRLQMRSIADINEAIDKNQFRLYFQEIHNLHNENLHSWEVLIRMFNKKGEFLLPGNFLPAAERFGIIKRVDSWVVDHALEKISNFFGESNQRAFPNVSINLSALTIMDNAYLDVLAERLSNYHIPPENISFEITETAVMSNLVKACAFMKKAKDMGFRFSLDDFGTGMSSLAYLRELPIDTVKIDMSFVENITEDPVKSAIVKSVNEVAHLLNLVVVAEGVETESQLDSLKQLGVDAIQGFYIRKPIPFEEFVDCV